MLLVRGLFFGRICTRIKFICIIPMRYIQLPENLGHENGRTAGTIWISKCFRTSSSLRRRPPPTLSWRLGRALRTKVARWPGRWGTCPELPWNRPWPIRTPSRSRSLGSARGSSGPGRSPGWSVGIKTYIEDVLAYQVIAELTGTVPAGKLRRL